ncbi:hypothetical protein ACHQM5_025387 [Ranunculus cassubicifolius]
MATDLEDNNHVGKTELISSIEVDCNGNGIAHQEVVIDGEKKVTDPAQPDHAGEAPVVEEKSEVDVVEESGPEMELRSQSEVKNDVDVNVQDETKGLLESNASVEEHAKLGSDGIVEEIQECVSEGADIVDSGLNQLGHHEKVEEEIKEEEGVPAVESNSLVLENGDDKVEDQVTSVCESELDLEPESVATDSVESELVQPLDGDNKSEEVNEPAASEEAEENQNTHPTIVEAPESESQKLDNEEQVEEQRELESSVEAFQPQDMEITATQPVETETSSLADGKDLETEESADYIFVEKPSSHLETENLVSGDATCVSDKTQVETEATNDADETEGSPNTPIEHAALEKEVINDSTDTRDTNSIDATGQIGTEAPDENGHVEDTNLSSSVVELKQEADVDDALTENMGEVVAPGVSADVDSAREESISTGSIDDLKSEAGLGSGSIEESKIMPDTTNDEDEIGGSPASHPVEQSTVETEAIDGDAVDENDKTASSPPQANGHIEDIALPSSGGIQLKPDENIDNLSDHKEVEAPVDRVAPADLEVPAERDEGPPACSVDDLKSEAVLGNGSAERSQSVPVIAENDVEKEANATDDFTANSNLSAGKTESDFGAGSLSPASKDELSSTATVNSEESNGIVTNGKSKPDSHNDLKDAVDEQDPSTCVDADAKPIREDNSAERNDSNKTLSPSPEESTTKDSEGTKVEVEKPFRYLIRIPRYVDDRFRTQIDLAQKQVDEKTRIRDELRSTFQSRRGIVGEYRDKFQAARSEERASRDALHAKRKEMDSVMLVINRMKNATSIEDIGDRVRGMQHRIEHETVPLKEEKQLIREIKQLKNLRDQLSSSLGQRDELEPTSDERVKTEERFKLLKQEMESCKKEVMRLEGITKAAWKVYHEENEKIKDLQDQFRASDELRQETYLHLQKLKKQFYDKNHYYRMFNEEVMKAKEYASAKDTDSLHSHCINQVETIMELWNKNDEFRNEYIRCNKFYTLRRLGTADGRALGPDEPAPLLYPVREVKVDQPVLASSNKTDFPSLPASEEGKSVVNLEQKKPKVDSKSVVNLEQKHSTVKSKTITKPVVPENSSATVSSKEEEQENEEMKRNRENEELARKEEELRKKEEAVKLKEQRRLEEKAKAKEAEERKKRNAEKAQARAELKAQKEAELKEKEREKRARKKERKKEKSEEGLESSSITEEIQPEITREPEIKEKPAKTAVKRLVIAKQAKPKVIPPPLPLRNRGKKRMQQWMWILLVVVAIIALFLIGNVGFSFNFGLSSFGF